MYCDKFRKRTELLDAMQTAYIRVSGLDTQDQEEFLNWTRHILLSTCNDKEHVAEAILDWLKNGDGNMAYKHNLQIMIENEMAQAFNKGHETGYSEGHEKSRLSDIQSLMDTMNWSAEQAMEALKIPEKEREQYLKKM